MSLLQNETKSYKCIVDFINAMMEVYPKNKELALYSRLLAHTEISNTVAIKKHIQVFSQFFENNPKFLVERIFTDGLIQYSEKVSLNIRELWIENVQNREPLHKHLLTIYTVIMVGTNECRETLKKIKEINKNKFPMPDMPDTNEGKFMKNTLLSFKEKIEDIGEDADPAQVIGSLLNGNFIQEFSNSLTSEIQSGGVDLNSLLSTVIGTFQKNTEGSGINLDAILGNLNLGEVLKQNAPEIKETELD